MNVRCSAEHPWSLWIWTSDLAGSGTDASILLQIYGEKGKSDEMRLDNKTDNFEQGQLDKFMVRSLITSDSFIVLFLTHTASFTD